jgi:transcriptional regulator with XRE-family HTH domain
MRTIDKINYYLRIIGKNGADLSRALGLSNSIYSQWNTGKSKPSPQKLPAIAEFLGVSVADILPDDEEVLPKAKKESASDPKTKGVKKAHATEGEDYTDLQKAAIQFVLSLPPEKLERFVKMGRAAFEEEQ